MAETCIVQPRITVLSPTQIEQVHEYSLKILSSVGVRVDSAQARQIFARALGPMSVSGDRVRIPRESVEWALEAAPVIYSNYSMAGMSAPLTPAGLLALLNAELLAGLTLSQLAREGTPVILGSLPAFFDMKEMTNFYDPHSLLLNLACAEMMAHYRLPHCGTSGSGTGWGPDLLAADTYWMNQLTSCIGKVGLAPFVGDTLGSKLHESHLSPAVDHTSASLVGIGRR